ncbi:MAG: hypothetical protein HOP10_08545 [Chitinophagaceae bacterium]|nr:hypothetical protein [Chitinophagaceae bacterium]
MKSINLPPLFFISNPLKAVTNEMHSRNESPYLRAILSGKATISKQEDDLKIENPDRKAASRYIRDSKLLRRK